jgi:type II secretion system protein H
VFLEPSTRALRGRRASRGFTLIELMAVVVIVAITATLATPEVLELMRERRGRNAAQSVALLYSTARARAMGRGAAVLVQYRATTGSFTVRESIDGQHPSEACRTQPGMGCLSTQWSVAANSRVIDGVQLNDANGDPTFEFHMFDPAGAEQTQLDICFTPLGRSFLSTTGEAPTTPMVGAAKFTIPRGLKSTRTFWNRSVVILPNGTARLGI